MSHIAEGETPAHDGEVLHPVGVPIEHIAVDVDRAGDHLLDHLLIVAELLALDEVDLEFARRAFVDELGEEHVLAIEQRADGVGSAERQCLLGRCRGRQQQHRQTHDCDSRQRLDATHGQSSRTLFVF